MRYEGRYKIFDTNRVNTYPLRTRTNKVTFRDLVPAAESYKLIGELPDKAQKDITDVAEAIVSARKDDRPVVFFTGAHLIKNGLGPVLVELINRKMVTLVSGNAATAIHDFELALVGQTSEDVPDALGKGRFGMAYEFSYINAALSIGNEQKLGFGESLGRMICDADFRNEVFSVAVRDDSPREFLRPETSVLAACYERAVPLTIHAGIGTDVIDQHPSFDGQAKGGCSGRDFLIYTEEMTKLTDGGVVLNVGSAVTGPEVLLKAVSMAANIGKIPRNIITADFDIRACSSEQVSDESAAGYYFRDQKSMVARVPEAFGGKGYYIQGNQKQTIPLLYQKIVAELSNTG